MSLFYKIFIAINIFYAVYGTYFWSQRSTISGTPGLATPGAWIPAWQGIGVGLVLYLNVSPLHLLWWWPVGCFAGVNLIWKLFCIVGIVPKNNIYNN